jgi:hypothetical protein
MDAWRFALTLCVAALGPTAAAGANLLHLRVQISDAELQRQTIATLHTGAAIDWRILRRTLEAIGPISRNELPFRVQGESVEFHFRGFYPFEQCDPGMLEYAVSRQGEKDHETLLSAGPEEMARLDSLKDLLMDRRHAKKPGVIDVRLDWEEGGKWRSVTAAEVLHGEKPAERAAFINNLKVNDSGLGETTNYKGDKTKLPSARVPARVRISIAIVP